jgi:transcriptional regulator GlxA family with amidase domain
MMLMFCTPRITKCGVSDEISVMEFDDGSSGLCPVAVDDKVHETSLYTTSVCSGSLLLGAAGLLNGPCLCVTVCWKGKIITAAGVSAGIDMALQLVALISDETTAKTVQLSMEYDPQPPFDCGSPEKAGPEIVSKAQLHMQAEMQQFAAELSK